MKLTHFSAIGYRNLDHDCSIELDDYTVLVGQNNEGKSNLLRAINLAFMAIENLVSPLSQPYLDAMSRATDERSEEPKLWGQLPLRTYNWHTDFPIRHQASLPTGGSYFKARFEVIEQETAELATIVGQEGDGTFEIQIIFGAKSNHFNLLTPLITGPGARSKLANLLRFVSRQFHVVYVPAVRTANQVNEIIQDLVAKQLEGLESLKEYRAAVDQVINLQAPILQAISTKLEPTLRQFFPSLRALEFDLSRQARLQALRVVDTLIDDGVKTSLASKGDGIQSLVAIALLRHVNEGEKDNRKMLLAIEEPEAHLHPAALHGLRQVLIELAKTKQVLISTHNAIFISREKPTSNIIVSQGATRKSTSLIDIRDILGIRISDNLTHAAIVFVVEGQTDRIALTSILSRRFPKVASAITDGRIFVDATGGASKAVYRLSGIAAAMAVPICFFDNDQAGRQAANAIVDAALITRSKVLLASLPGRVDSELEDLYSPAVYMQAFAHYGVVVDPQFLRSRKKWSERSARLFARQARSWDERSEESIKLAVAQEAASIPHSCIPEQNLGPIQALGSSLEQLLGELD
jgi:putative ATP-dependent endonuclease of OLD family